MRFSWVRWPFWVFVFVAGHLGEPLSPKHPTRSLLLPPCGTRVRHSRLREGGQQPCGRSLPHACLAAVVVVAADVGSCCGVYFACWSKTCVRQGGVCFIQNLLPFQKYGHIMLPPVHSGSEQENLKCPEPEPKNNLWFWNVEQIRKRTSFSRLIQDFFLFLELLNRNVIWCD